MVTLDSMIGYLSTLAQPEWLLLLRDPWAVAAIVFGILWLVSFLRSSDASDTSKVVRQLLQSSAQWNTTSLQDNNPILGLMHANYAMAYMNVARSMASDLLIEKWTKVHLDELVKTYQDTQSSAIQTLNHVCPTTMPPGLAAVYTGWITKGKA